MNTFVILITTNSIKAQRAQCYIEILIGVFQQKQGIKPTSPLVVTLLTLLISASDWVSISTDELSCSESELNKLPIDSLCLYLLVKHLS